MRRAELKDLRPPKAAERVVAKAAERVAERVAAKVAERVAAKVAERVAARNNRAMPRDIFIQ